jgi:hypothetical protein
MAQKDRQTPDPARLTQYFEVQFVLFAFLQTGMTSCQAVVAEPCQRRARLSKG